MEDREYIDWWDADTALVYYRDDGITAYSDNSRLVFYGDLSKMQTDFILIARRPCLLVGTAIKWLEQTVLGRVAGSG